MGMTVGSLFSGIGGLDLGLERAGMHVSWQVEIDDYCNKVLEKHWPDVARFRDVRDCGNHNLAAVDLICGGFPCQPFSEAGQRRGELDDRNLWPEMRRVIAALGPTWVVAENVPGIRRLYLDTVISDLEDLDYSTITLDLPACAFGAWHIRHRLFILAHADQERRTDGGRMPGSSTTPRRTVITSNLDAQQEKRTAEPRQECVPWPPEPDVGRVVYGVSGGLDRARVAALGNAVVPQVAEWIGRRIMEVREDR